MILKTVYENKLPKVFGCGCIYRKENIGREFGIFVTVEAELADYLCDKHFNQYILKLYNENIKSDVISKYRYPNE